jgi:hypothetical protein
VCIRTGFTVGAACPLVVLDADGVDALAVVERLLAETCTGLKVPKVQTQRGPAGRHYYFRAVAQGAAASLKSSAKLVIRGVQTNVDVRAGSNGDGVGCILAPPTAVVGGGKCVLLPGPPIHEAPAMPDALAVLLGAGRVLNPKPPKGTACHKSTGTGPLMAAALRDATVRAGDASVGTPVRVVCERVLARACFARLAVRLAVRIKTPRTYTLN